jgi:hypothetical protein
MINIERQKLNTQLLALCIFHRGFSGIQAVNFLTILVRIMTENHTQIPTVLAIYSYGQKDNIGID